MHEDLRTLKDCQMTSLESATVTAEQPQSVDRVRVRVLPDGRMTRADAARYLGVEPKTLANWAYQRRGPQAYRLMGRNFYYQADLDAFLKAQSGIDGPVAA